MCYHHSIHHQHDRHNRHNSPPPPSCRTVTSGSFVSADCARVKKRQSLDFNGYADATLERTKILRSVASVFFNPGPPCRKRVEQQRWVCCGFLMGHNSRTELQTFMCTPSSHSPSDSYSSTSKPHMSSHSYSSSPKSPLVISLTHTRHHKIHHLSSSSPVSSCNEMCRAYLEPGFVVNGIELVLRQFFAWMARGNGGMDGPMCWLAGAVRALLKEVHEVKGLLVERTERDQDDLKQLPTQVGAMSAPATTRTGIGDIAGAALCELTGSHLGDTGDS